MGKVIGFGPVLAALVWGSATAEQYVDVGDYKIHYIALSTDTLRPEVAGAYGIVRSQNRAMLNITVMRKAKAGELDQPVEAVVTASATNLTGQRREMEMRLISEQEAKYYVGVVRVAHEEIIDFRIEVHPHDAPVPYEIVFRQQFFINY